MLTSKDYIIKEKKTPSKGKVVKEVFCFPDYGISIEAENKEEAEKKLKEILKKNK